MARNLRRLTPSGVSMPFGLWRHGLDCKAMGLLYTLLGLCEVPDWEFSIRGLAALLPDGKDSILTGVTSLQSAGFLRRSRVRQEGGQLAGSDWVISDRPMGEEVVEGVDAPVAGFPPQAEPPQVSPTAGFPPQGNPPQYSSSSSKRKKEPRREENKSDASAFGEEGGPTIPSPMSAQGLGVELMRATWNESAPTHWPRMSAGSVSPTRIKKFKALAKDLGGWQAAAAALEASLRAAAKESWCMKPEAKLTVENWFSNDKVIQYAEKAGATEQPVAISMTSEQREVIEEATASGFFSSMHVNCEGHLMLTYTDEARNALNANLRPTGPPWPEETMVYGLQALRLETEALMGFLHPIDEEPEATSPFS